MFIASTSRKIPTTGNRPSRPATKRRRVGDPSTLIVALEDLPLFIALVLAVPFRGAPFHMAVLRARRAGGSKRAVAETRTEKEQARTKPNERGGRGARKRNSEGGKRWRRESVSERGMNGGRREKEDGSSGVGRAEGASI